MEINIEKSEIVSRCTVLEQVIEQNIDADITLPDYLPEISRVLKCFASPMLLSKNVLSDSVTVDSDVPITVLYSDSTGEINSFEYVVPFTRSVDLKECENSSVEVLLKTEYLNYRAKDKRKIDIHGAIGITVKMVKDSVEEVISAIDGKNIETKYESISVTEPIASIEKISVIDEEFPLGEGDSYIQSVVRYSAKAEITDSKIISGKIIVKGNIKASILYVPVGSNKHKTYKTEIPIHQIIDAPEVDENDISDISATVSAVDIKPHKDSSGNYSEFSFEAKLVYTAKCYREEEKNVIVDAYSTSNEYTAKSREIRYTRLTDNINESFLCGKSLEFKESGLSSVTDMWPETRFGGIKKQDSSLSVSGTVTLCILGYDSDNTAAYYEKPIDFEYTLPIKSVPECYTAECEITVSDLSYVITDSNKLDAKLMLNVNCKIFEIKTVNVLSEFSVSDQKKTSSCNDFALAVCYGCSNEDIWSIAKKYNTSVKSILEANGLSEENISERKMLLIPCM